MGFGTGVHVCLRKHLARLEMLVALNLLLDQFAVWSRMTTMAAS
jgi:cytochrome P450